MPTLTCPHCGKPVELVGQKELKADYGMGPNPILHAQQLGLFPDPVLVFPNRRLWLREDVDRYMEQKTENRIRELVADFEQTIAVLPESQREQAREMLAAENHKKRR